MILKIDIHIYTDKDASVLSLKKNPKTKQRKDLLTYLRYFFLKLGLLHARLDNHYEAWNYKKKSHKKVEA